jgi:hypothetical protein
MCSKFIHIKFFITVAYLGLSLYLPAQSQKLDLANPPEVSIYPNPVVNDFQLLNAQDVEKIVIYNWLGREVRKFINEREEQLFEIGDLPKGFYYVQMRAANNQIIITRRISKN